MFDSVLTRLQINDKLTDWKMLPLPIWLVLVHEGIAICGFLLLVIATWKVSHA